ncbi:MAG: hypothetical protein KDD52_06385 [Bdellovibrionales bacterium]|nr:hypothetical protein [Bdellovibrionales bacterium]
MIQKIHIARAWKYMLMYTYFILIWGTYVRVSRSGSGCGVSWPDCQGSFFVSWSFGPQWIEYIHRASSGLYGLLAVFLCVVTWRSKASRIAKGICLVFLVLLFLEAWIGRILVIQEYVVGDHRVQRMLWMGFHFLNTLLLSASLIFLWQELAQGWLSIHQSVLKCFRRLLSSVDIWFFIGVCLFGVVAAFFDTSIVESGKQASILPWWVIWTRNAHPLVALSYVGISIFRIGYQSREYTQLHMFLLVMLVMNVVVGTANVLWHHLELLQLVHVFNTHLIWMGLILFRLQSMSFKKSS